MATNQKAQKKLPKRTSNAHRKAYRASLWAKQQKRKEARRKAQESRAQFNRARGFTTWELKRKAARAAARFH